MEEDAGDGRLHVNSNQSLVRVLFDVKGIVALCFCLTAK